MKDISFKTFLKIAAILMTVLGVILVVDSYQKQAELDQGFYDQAMESSCDELQKEIEIYEDYLGYVPPNYLMNAFHDKGCE